MRLADDGEVALGGGYLKAADTVLHNSTHTFCNSRQVVHLLGERDRDVLCVVEIRLLSIYEY